MRVYLATRPFLLNQAQAICNYYQNLNATMEATCYVRCYNIFKRYHIPGNSLFEWIALITYLIKIARHGNK